VKNKQIAKKIKCKNIVWVDSMSDSYNLRHINNEEYERMNKLQLNN